MTDIFNRAADFVHEMIFSGGIKKGGTWGGPQCAASVPLDVHYYETAAWILVAVVMFFIFDFPSYIRNIYKESKHSFKEATHWLVAFLEKILAIIHFGMWFQILYYKVNLRSLVNLLQPCHLALFLQGLALVDRSPMSTILTLVTLPMTIGAVGALIVPATEGLDQPFEEISFFIQHYVLLFTPIILLVRNGFHAWKLSSLKNLFFGNWFAIALHWILFAPLNRYFQVNVNFFLCPSEGMAVALQSMPSWILLPSYRTMLTISVFFSALVICWVYLSLVTVLRYLFLVNPLDSKLD